MLIEQVKAYIIQ